MEFEWDEKKAHTNLKKHGIDFEDAIGIFEGAVLERRSNHESEERGLAIGELEGVAIVVVYTVRKQRRRIISARRAGRHERRAYQEAKSGGPEEGQDGLEPGGGTP